MQDAAAKLTEEMRQSRIDGDAAMEAAVREGPDASLSRKVVGVGRFELPTLNPQSSGSTTELHPDVWDTTSPETRARS